MVLAPRLLDVAGRNEERFVTGEPELLIVQFLSNEGFLLWPVGDGAGAAASLSCGWEVLDRGVGAEPLRKCAESGDIGTVI